MLVIVAVRQAADNRWQTSLIYPQECSKGSTAPPKSSRTFQPRSCFLFGFARDELDDVAIVSSSKYPLSLLQSVLFVGPAFTAPPRAM